MTPHEALRPDPAAISTQTTSDDAVLSSDAVPDVDDPPSTQAVDAFCTRCGVTPGAGDHSTCERWLASEEPPRFCAQCGRRMKVQIIPTGWSAECSRHGQISGGAGV